jgi:hypothetical protein
MGQICGPPKALTDRPTPERGWRLSTLHQGHRASEASGNAVTAHAPNTRSCDGLRALRGLLLDYVEVDATSSKLGAPGPASVGAQPRCRLVNAGVPVQRGWR